MNLKLFNYSLITVDKTESTNSLLRHLKANQKLSNGTVLLALEQTNGRGQKGNEWVTKPGLNITCSIYTKPDIVSQKAFYLNMVSALAVRKTLSDLNIECEIKWPNDILVDGKKIAGILIENQLTGKRISNAIIGIGLNVNQTEFGNINGTSIQLITKIHHEIEDILKQAYQYLDFYFDLLVQSNFALLDKHYLKHLYRLKEPAEFEDQDGKFLGEIVGINAVGHLTIKKNNGKVYHYDIQEIRYL